MKQFKAAPRPLQEHSELPQGNPAADMNRTTHRLIASGLAAASLGLAAAAVRDGRDASVPALAGQTSFQEVSFIQSVAQVRWGHGAMDWLLPDDQGDRNGRKPEPRT